MDGDVTGVLQHVSSEFSDNVARGADDESTADIRAPTHGSDEQVVWRIGIDCNASELIRR